MSSPKLLFAIAVFLVVTTFGVGWFLIASDEDYADEAREMVRVGKFAEAENVYGKAIGQAQAHHKIKKTADLEEELGDLFVKKEKIRDAEVTYRHALSSMESAQATANLDRSSLLTRQLEITAKLANTLNKLDQVDESATLYQKVLAADSLALTFTERSKISMEYVAVLRKQHKDKEAEKLQIETEASTSGSSVLSNANVAFNHGQFQKAETMYRLLLRDPTATNFEDQAGACCMLAICTLRSKGADKAESLLQESLNFAEKIYDPHVRNDARARALTVLSFCALKSNDADRSNKYWRDAISAYPQSTGDALFRMAIMFQLTKRKGDLEILLRLYEKWLAHIPDKKEKITLLRMLETTADGSQLSDQAVHFRQLESALQPEDKAAQTGLMVGQAHAYIAAGQSEKAIPLWLSIITYFEKTHNENLLRSATLELCSCLSNSGKTKEARDRLVALVDRCAKSPKEGFLDEALVDLGVCHRQLGNIKQSLSEFQRALPLVAKRGDSATLATLWYYDLADAYRRLEMHAKVEESCKQALVLFKKRSDIQATSFALETLAFALEEQKKMTEATAVWRELLVYCKQHFGDKSVVTTQCLLRLGIFALSRHDVPAANDYLAEAVSNLESMNDDNAKAAKPIADEIATYCPSAYNLREDICLRVKAWLNRQTASTLH